MVYRSLEKITIDLTKTQESQEKAIAEQTKANKIQQLKASITAERMIFDEAIASNDNVARKKSVEKVKHYQAELDALNIM